MGRTWDAGSAENADPTGTDEQTHDDEHDTGEHFPSDDVADTGDETEDRDDEQEQGHEYTSFAR